MCLDERKFEGGEGLVLIDVADGRHEGTDDHLGVILEEVDLREGEGMEGGREKGWKGGSGEEFGEGSGRE